MSKDGCWITLVEGGSFSLSKPDPADVNIRDIAHALSNICRFTGHTRTFYSVAQHCLEVAKQASPEARLWALLHDAHEAYIGDISRPCGLELGTAVAHLKKRVDEAICTALQYWPSTAIKLEVKSIDSRMLITEGQQLCSADTRDWPVIAAPFDVKLVPWPAGNARSYYEDAVNHELREIIRNK